MGRLLGLVTVLEILNVCFGHVLSRNAMTARWMSGDDSFAKVKVTHLPLFGSAHGFKSSG